MAYAGETTGAQYQTSAANTSVENLVPELWSDMIFDYLQKKLIFKNVVQDYSELVRDRGDVIHVPKLVAGTGAQQADLGNAGNDSGATIAAVQFDRTNELEATITIDQHWYASKMVTDPAKVQSQPGLMEKYTMSIGYDLANKIDLYIASVIKAGLNTNTVTSSTADDALTLGDFADAFANLRSKNVDPVGDGCVLLANYKVFGALMNPATTAGAYISKNDVVAGANNLVTGQVPTLWGVPVLMSNSIGTGAGEDAAYLLHPHSFGYASSIAPRVTAQYDIDYLSTKVVADSLFGCAAINEDYSAKIVNAG